MDQVNTNRFIGTRIEAWLRREQRHTTTLEIPELQAAIGTTTGEVRKDNQDRAVVARMSIGPVPRLLTIFAVCDGLGGMADGAQCAERTLAVLLDSFIQSGLENLKDRLRAAIITANQEVFRQYRQRGGTTLALLCRTSDSCIAATAGDTRVYSLTPKAPLKQISIDDTVAGELRRMKDLNPENLERFANQLAQFIGVGPELEPRFYVLPPRKDTSYFIASDGAYNIGTAFESILVNAPSPHVAAQRIIQTSRWVGGKDNASIICVGTDHPNAEFGPEEPILELWNATAKLEIMLGIPLRMLERLPRPPVPRKEPIPKQKYRNRKRPKDEQPQVEHNSPIPTRPTLQIDFGEPSKEHHPNELPPKSDDSRNDLTAPSPSAEPQPTAAHNDEKTDGPDRRNLQNS